MSVTVIRRVPAFLLVVMLFASPVWAERKAKRLPPAGVHRTTIERLGLYSQRVRRSTATYLRLRLLELREEDLDRARAAIQRRLSVDELLLGSAPAGGRARATGTPIPRRESTP